MKKLTIVLAVLAISAIVHADAVKFEFDSGSAIQDGAYGFYVINQTDKVVDGEPVYQVEVQAWGLDPATEYAVEKQQFEFGRLYPNKKGHLKAHFSVVPSDLRGTVNDRLNIWTAKAWDGWQHGGRIDYALEAVAAKP